MIQKVAAVDTIARNAFYFFVISASILCAHGAIPLFMGRLRIQAQYEARDVKAPSKT
jgi:hypothetical protein